MRTTSASERHHLRAGFRPDRASGTRWSPGRPRPTSVAPIPNTSRLSCSLDRVVVPSCAASATSCARPALAGGSTASPALHGQDCRELRDAAVADGDHPQAVRQRPLDASAAAQTASRVRPRASGSACAPARGPASERDRGDGDEHLATIGGQSSRTSLRRLRRRAAVDGRAVGRRTSHFAAAAFTSSTVTLSSSSRIVLMRPGSSSNNAKTPSRLARPKRGIDAALELVEKRRAHGDLRLLRARLARCPFRALSASTLSIADSTWSAVLSVEVVHAHGVEHRPFHVPVAAEEIEAAARRTSPAAPRARACDACGRCRRCSAAGRARSARRSPSTCARQVPGHRQRRRAGQLVLARELLHLGLRRLGHIGRRPAASVSESIRNGCSASLRTSAAVVSPTTTSTALFGA